jgi:hypothetical protein
MSRRQGPNPDEVRASIAAVMFSDGAPHAAEARALFESGADAATAKARALANHTAGARTAAVVFIGRN